MFSESLTSLEGLYSLSDCVVCWYPMYALNGLKEDSPTPVAAIKTTSLLLGVKLRRHDILRGGTG